ncbi:MAG TPA: DUF6390 family protein [Candidatus Paceibacterota bacterium]|nr:DUF6390 family protein [Candidatus Paceibacterota bacterium]
MIDSLVRCSRYAFGPNRLHYCGPERNAEMKGYIDDSASDAGLGEILGKFETMYPYLCHIAEANKISDPLDARVVEAYWVGNALLDRVAKRDFFRHLVDGLRLKDKLGKSFVLVEDKLAKGAVPHHSFHVFDIWKRTGHIEREHTVESMDECRVAWGTVVSAAGPFVTVSTERLFYANGKLALGPAEPRSLVRRLESEYDIEQLKAGDLVTIHWGVICEVITARQLAYLKKYTLRHLALANETL